MSKIKGGEILCAVLDNLGVDTVFGLPGTQNLKLYDSFRRSSIRSILATDETAAAFMANGYYRASGKPAVVAAIPGPGFTNALTGIAEAWHDSVALIMIVETNDETPGKDFQLQAVDMRAMAKSVSKAFIQIPESESIAARTEEAFRLAVSGEPGPVIIEIESSALYGSARYQEPTESCADLCAEDYQIDEVIHRISGAGRVAILAGQGAFSAGHDLLKLAELLGAPVVTNCSGRGAIPESHELSIVADFCLGPIDEINSLFDKCDLVLAIGCKFSHNGTSGFELRISPEKLVRVDSSKRVLESKNYPANMSILSDAGSFVRALLERKERLSKRSSGFDKLTVAKISENIRSKRKNNSKFDPGIKGLLMADFFHALNSSLRGDACVVTDTGFHQALARNYLRIESIRGLIVPSDYQSIGYGIPAAIGARLACPERDVVAIVGDCSFMSSAMELRTAVRKKIDLAVILFNDGKLGSIRMQQLAAYGEEFSVSLDNPDFSRLAEALGVNYIKLDGNPDAAFERLLRSEGVRLLEVRLEDSPEIEKMRRRSALREKVSNSVLGAPLKKLKRWVDGQ
jgi:acetolactate synthase-1/2/3 large subunit